MRVAVEFRHPSWHDEAVFALLERHGAAYCVMSGAGLPCVLRATAPFVYVRLHGPDPDHLYAGSYSDDDLRWWADRDRRVGRRRARRLRLLQQRRRTATPSATPSGCASSSALTQPGSSPAACLGPERGAHRRVDGRGERRVGGVAREDGVDHVRHDLAGSTDEHERAARRRGSGPPARPAARPGRRGVAQVVGDHHAGEAQPVPQQPGDDAGARRRPGRPVDR